MLPKSSGKSVVELKMHAMQEMQSLLKALSMMNKLHIIKK